MKCSKCSSESVSKGGTYITKRGIVQRYNCRSCGVSFSISPHNITKIESGFTQIDDDGTLDPIEDEGVELASLISAGVKMAKVKQRLMDTQRIERATARNTTRIVNSMEPYVIALTDAITNNMFSPVDIIDHPVIDTKPSGIIHISDAHFNEVTNIQNNTYNFSVAAKRLRKLVLKATQQFKFNGVTEVVLALGGDLINSDRLLAERMQCATNRSNATFIAVDLLQSVIRDLNKDFNISVISVSGNESRIGQHWFADDIIATDNYDQIIYNILKCVFTQTSVKFIKANPVEALFTLNGQNILLTHGNHFKQAGMDRQITELMGRYVAGTGTVVNYVLMGHYHNSYISDMFARSASLCGGNAYSDKQLNLAGRASQNIFVVDDTSINGMRIDLQNTDDVVGYNINSDMYNITLNEPTA